MIAGDTVLVQAEKSTISASTWEHFTQVSTDRAPIMKSTLEVATQEATTISTSEAFVVTSEMRQLTVQLVPVRLGETNASPLLYESNIATIVKTGSGSAPPAPTLVMDIVEELTLQIVGQFFVMMRYCIELIFSGQSPFEFMRSLLEKRLKILDKLEVLIM